MDRRIIMCILDIHKFVLCFIVRPPVSYASVYNSIEALLDNRTSTGHCPVHYDKTDHEWFDSVKCWS
jgi:hypothetical protein